MCSSLNEAGGSPGQFAFSSCGLLESLFGCVASIISGVSASVIDKLSHGLMTVKSNSYINTNLPKTRYNCVWLYRQKPSLFE